MDEEINIIFNSITTGLDNKENLYSPLVLAYLGDAVYELYIRTYILSKGNMSVNKMHKSAKELVCAKAQSQIYHKIEPILTETELGVLKRGRNAKSGSSSKNGDITEYRHATGLEALIGYLHIKCETNRIIELISIGMNNL